VKTVKDFESIIKEFLDQDEFSLIVYKEDQVIHQISDRGIKPLYELAYFSKTNLHASTVLDKIIGEAAARICIDKKVDRVFGKVMSQKAYDRLIAEGIEARYEKLTPVIKNRTNTGMCPVEKISSESENIQEMKNKIQKFLDSLK
jgi:hypothetical protein